MLKHSSDNKWTIKSDGGSQMGGERANGEFITLWHVAKETAAHYYLINSSQTDIQETDGKQSKDFGLFCFSVKSKL